MLKLKNFTAAIIALSIAVSSSCIVLAGGDKGIAEFRWAILGGESQTDRLQRTKCFVEKTKDLLGVPTKMFVPADYNGIIEAFLGGNLDAAWIGASGYAKIYLSDPEAVQPVLAVISKDGLFGYYAIGFARKDSGIRSIGDLKGKTFAFGDPNSTSGYLIPSVEIPLMGYTMTPGDHFGDVVFSGGHEQTIVGVFNGDYDAGVTWSGGMGEWDDGYDYGALRKAVDAGLVDMTEMREIWRSKVIPEGPIVIRKSLPEDVKIKIVGMVAGLSSLDKECAYGFFQGEVKGTKVVTHEDYEVLVAARKAKLGG